MSKVLILDCENYESVGDKIVEVFSFFPNNWKNKSVLLKPNMLNSRGPEFGNTTHPSFIKALTQWLLKAEASVIVGDNPGTNGTGVNERCAKGTGIEEASLGCYRNISQEPLTINLNSKYAEKVVISKTIIDVDILISIPKFKTHSLTQITGAIKNSFGFLIGGDKGRIHAVTGNYENFLEAILDIYLIRKPDLVIMDAVIGMEGNGPSSGPLRHIGKIIASDDGVAIDSVMAFMMGKSPEKIKMLKMAKERKIGETDISKIEIVGELKAIDGFRMPSTFLSQFAGRVYNNHFARSLVWSKPIIKKDKCKNCGICAKNCPVKAMSTDNKIPLIDRKTCIRCYCCQELCPNDAIELRRFV